MVLVKMNIILIRAIAIQALPVSTAKSILMNVVAILATMAGYVSMVFLTTPANVYQVGLEPCAKPVFDVVFEMQLFNILFVKPQLIFLYKEISLFLINI